MSDTEQKPVEKSLFTAKEDAVLKIALLCLKGGPPEVDIEKLQKLGGFNTAKTAANTWGVIKKKLATMNTTEGAEGDGAAASPVKAKATPKKRGKAISEPKVDDDDDEETKSPKKKAKATPKKKKVVKAESDEEAAGDEAAEEAMT